MDLHRNKTSSITWPAIPKNDRSAVSFVTKGKCLRRKTTECVNGTIFICRFKNVHTLQKHMRSHSDVKPHICDVCGKKFRERSKLLIHNRIHSGSKPFECDFCGKSFRFKDSFNVSVALAPDPIRSQSFLIVIVQIHRRTHTGERPYSCAECDHHFTNWPNYNKHMKGKHGMHLKLPVLCQPLLIFVITLQE